MTILEAARLLNEYYHEEPGIDFLSEDALERLEAVFEKKGEDYEEDVCNRS